MNIPSHIFGGQGEQPVSLDEIAEDVFAEDEADEPVASDAPNFARLVPTVFEKMQVELNTPPAGDPALAIAGYAQELGIQGEAEFFNWLMGVVRSAQQNSRPWQGGPAIAAYLQELKLATDTYNGKR